ncbi:MAG TPA: hypothetical protein VGR00_09030 [Thermoanaerobaculia bacterium]|nr:hypothetical protein [Thermoanaerobaculia bacterium]
MEGKLTPVDAQDLASEIALRLLRRLQSAEPGEGAEPIDDLHDYVRVMVHNVLEDLRKREDPLRARLNTRLRYVLTHTPGLALWGEEPLCGLEAWKGRPVVRVVVGPDMDSWSAEGAAELRVVVERVLSHSRGPVALEALVDALAERLGFSTSPFVSTDALSSSSVEPDVQLRLEGAAYLRELWSEITLLPPRQRTALLLSLRLEDGESVTRVLAAFDIAPIRAVAKTLEMPLSGLLSIWSDIPLPDERIALMLGATRRQVINLRKSARERLARRMGRPR